MDKYREKGFRLGWIQVLSGCSKDLFSLFLTYFSFYWLHSQSGLW